VLTSTLLLTAVFGVFLGYYFLAAQFLQLIEGLSPIAAGLTLVLGTITLVPGAVVAPTLVARFGLRPVLSLGLLPMIAAFLLLTRVEDGRSGLFVLSLLLLAATLGLCMTPATVAILHGVPPGKQGVASAINDAAREVGAALGIAVTGSVLATVYSRNLGPATKSLPPAARDAAESSLAGALQIGSQLGPTAGPAVQEAKTAFVSGLHGAFLASAVFTALVAIGVAAFGPRRTAPPTPALEQAAVAQRH
jgi:MFS family permease